MVTLNPFTIYENITEAKGIAECLPYYLSSIEGAVAGEHEKARVALRKLGKLKRDTFKKDGGIYPQLLEALCALDIPEGEVVEFKGHKSALPAIKQSEVCAKACDAATQIACGTLTGFAAGGMTGALVGFGAFSLVGFLGTASTGTAISSLGGAAAVNATLAWLGGGTLAAGGFGMAGGAVVLTGLVAVPALLITGISLGAKSEKLNYEAKSELEKMRAHEKEVAVIQERLREIAKLAAFAQKILGRLGGLAQRFYPSIVGMCGVDIRNADKEAQEKVYRACTVCNFMDAFANINIVDEEGKLCEQARPALEGLDANINNEWGEE